LVFLTVIVTSPWQRKENGGNWRKRHRTEVEWRQLDIQNRDHPRQKSQ